MSSGYDPKELSGNKDCIDLWNLHFLLACLKHISRTWDYVCILSNPFIKYILHNAFPLEGSLCDLSITMPTSEEKHWICIILVLYCLIICVWLPSPWNWDTCLQRQMLKSSLVFSIILVCDVSLIETSEVEVSLSFCYMLRLIREKTGLDYFYLGLFYSFHYKCVCLPL